MKTKNILLGTLATLLTILGVIISFWVVVVFLEIGRYTGFGTSNEGILSLGTSLGGGFLTGFALVYILSRWIDGEYRKSFLIPACIIPFFGFISCLFFAHWLGVLNSIGIIAGIYVMTKEKIQDSKHLLSPINKKSC